MVRMLVGGYFDGKKSVTFCGGEIVRFLHSFGGWDAVR